MHILRFISNPNGTGSDADVICGSDSDCQLPSPLDVTVTNERIWSSDTGRTTTTGTMAGHIVAIKTTLSVTFAPLTEAEAKILDGILTPTATEISSDIKNKNYAHSYIYIKYRSPHDNAYVKKQFYVGTITYPVYSYNSKLKNYNGVTVEFVQK